MSDWKVYPKVTVEVSEADAAQLFGLEGVDGLEGWKIFRKIKRAFKKVGKVIKKVAKSKVFKIALPIAGAFFAPLALAKIGTVGKVLGGKIGRLVGAGKTKAILVKTATGAKKIGLVSPSEYERFRGILRNPTDAVSEAIFRQNTGEDIELREAENAQISGGEVSFPVQNQPVVSTASTIPTKAGMSPVAMIAGAALVAMTLGRKGR